MLKHFIPTILALFTLTSYAVDDLYLNKIQPIFAGKCIACHGCNASPCEMKMDSFEAVDRGANKAHQPFNKHISDLGPLRMKDAKTTAEWRAKLFFPVLARTEDPTQNLQQSLLFKFIQSGMANNDAKNIDLDSLAPLMENEAYNIGKRSCPDINEVDAFLAKPEHKHAGMPLALPSLTPQEFMTLTEWVEAGSPGPSAAAMKEINALTEAQAALIQKWENFFNPPANATESDRNKIKLVSRYLYEHVVITRLEIEGVPGKFFELVRAKSATGAIEELVTQVAMDKVPGDGTFFYRLKPINEVIVQKSHIVWKLNDKKMARLKELFYDVKWKEPVADVPYVTDNPFYNFAQIPAIARSRWMLDEAKLIINGMIRGPVCVGPSATYAIRDQFWVFFANPQTDITVLDPTLGAVPAGRLPTPDQVEFMMAKNFTDLGSSLYRRRFESTYKRLKFEKGNPSKQGWTLADVWDGKDPNFSNPDQAVETVFRNGTSATVEAGARGRVTPTLWFMTYAGFERLYYNLVTQYKYWGEIQHRIETWQTMRRHREEYEDGFIALLPEDVREATRKSWTTSLTGRILRHGLISRRVLGRLDERREAESIKAIDSFVDKLRKHIGAPSMKQWDSINIEHAGLDVLPARVESFAAWEAALANITAKENQKYAQFLPEAVYVKLKVGTEERLYSLLTYRGYDTHNFSIDQKYARNAEEDFLTAYPGIIGDFPNLIVNLDAEKSADFLKAMVKLSSEQDFKEFQKNYGLLRNDVNFWDVFAKVQDLNFQNVKSEAGLLDLNYYGGY